MLTNDSDKEWEHFGKDDPYYGVLTFDKYKSGNLTEKNKEEFFQTGVDYINTLQEKVKKHLDPGFKMESALDFGCGVGRLVIPLAAMAKRVHGIDISESMLGEARKNCETRSLQNVTFSVSDDNLTRVTGKFNFIHSYIVFQHIPVKRGEHIFRLLLSRLENGGCGVLHFVYGNDSRKRKLDLYIRKYIPLARNIINVIKGRNFFAPHMQMNEYHVNNLFFILQMKGIKEFHIEFTKTMGHMGIILYFKKP